MAKIITVVAGIIIKEEKILLARRSSKKHLAGFWEYPGGKVEANEEEEECLKRELLEELGIKVRVKKFFMLNRHRYDEKEILLKSYFCDMDEDQIFTLIDHDRVEWVNIENMLNYRLAPADVPIAKALNERNNI